MHGLHSVSAGVKYGWALSLCASLPEQLELKLDSKKDPVDMLVVDSAARLPTEN